MNKLKTLVVAIGVLILAESAALVYYASKSQDLSKKLENIRPGYQNLLRTEQEIKAKYNQLAKQQADLFKQNEAMKEDRSNLLAQLKNLLGEKTRAQELTVSFQKVNDEIAALQKVKQEVDAQVLSLNDEIKQLNDSQDKITQERDDLKVAYEKARKDTIVKDLNSKISDLQHDLGDLQASVKDKQRSIDKLAGQKSDLEAYIEQLKAQLNDYKRNYAQADKSNRKLEQEVKNIPGKFSEIARQNKRLIRDTAEMHYNLGVFYTRNKEYGRAIAEFEKVVDILPDDAYAHFNLGYIYAEYQVNRPKAIEHFRHFLRLAKSNDRDVDWVKKYLLTWETYEGRQPMQ